MPKTEIVLGFRIFRSELRHPKVARLPYAPMDEAEAWRITLQLASRDPHGLYFPAVQLVRKAKA